jgi:hypothetical protein
MNNPNQNETPAPLIPCVSYLGEVIRKEDRNGYCIFTDVQEWDMGQLIETLRACFESFVVEARAADAPLDSIPNYDDRLNALETLHRYSYYGFETFAAGFMELAPYVLRNIYPEDAAPAFPQE